MVCSGLVTDEPNYIVEVADGLDNLRVFFESD